jgi:hypothetical protein
MKEVVQNPGRLFSNTIRRARRLAGRIGGSCPSLNDQQISTQSFQSASINQQERDPPTKRKFTADCRETDICMDENGWKYSIFTDSQHLVHRQSSHGEYTSTVSTELSKAIPAIPPTFSIQMLRLVPTSINSLAKTERESFLIDGIGTALSDVSSSRLKAPFSEAAHTARAHQCTQPSVTRFPILPPIILDSSARSPTPVLPSLRANTKALFPTGTLPQLPDGPHLPPHLLV